MQPKIVNYIERWRIKETFLGLLSGIAQFGWAVQENVQVYSSGKNLNVLHEDNVKRLSYSCPWSYRFCSHICSTQGGKCAENKYGLEFESIQWYMEEMSLAQGKNISDNRQSSLHNCPWGQMKNVRMYVLVVSMLLNPSEE